MKYFWIRVYEYNYGRDGRDKGIMLDEFYLKGDTLTRDEAKNEVKNRYIGQTRENISFAKPRKKDGLYAMVMDSEQFYYDYFSKEIDTYCFHCHKPIKGKWRDFPRETINNTEYSFCSYECRNKLHLNQRYEGEFQEKEKLSQKIAGYIYHIYNRIQNKHYVGQTKYLPFFRWQEHIKNGAKGNITDLTFDVITEVTCESQEDGQKYLNNAEAWWIKKYIEEGYEVFNVTVPKLTMDDYEKAFNDMVKKQIQLNFKEEHHEL